MANCVAHPLKNLKKMSNSQHTIKMCLSNILQEKATRISQPYNNTSSTLLHLIKKKEKKKGKKRQYFRI